MRRSLSIVSILLVGLLVGLRLRSCGSQADAVERSPQSAVAADAPGDEESAALRAPSSDGQLATARDERRAPEAPDAAPVVASTVRVVEADGITPVAGFDVRALLLEKRPGGTPDRSTLEIERFKTDERGLFTVGAQLDAVPGAAFVRFFPPFRPELRVEPAELERAALEAVGAAPVTLRLVPRELGPIRGVALDAETGAPLQQVALQVYRWLDTVTADVTLEDVYAGRCVVPDTFYGPHDAEWIVTDDAGLFRTERAYPRGRIVVMTFESEMGSGFHDPSAAAGLTTVPLICGPFVRLAFEPGGERDPTEYLAGLSRDPEGLLESYGIDAPITPLLSERAASDTHSGNVVPVQVLGQGNGGSFARMSKEHAATPLPSELFLVSRDGASFGHAAIDSFERYRNEPLRIELTAGHGLECTVAWPAEYRVPAGTYVRLQALSDPSGEPREQHVGREEDEPESNAVFAWLPPGPYRLELSAAGLRPTAIDLSVPADARALLRPERVEAQELHLVALRVRTESGSALDGQNGRAHLPRVSLWPNEGSGASFDALNPMWTDGVAYFIWHRVPAGTYRARADWSSGAYPLEGVERTIEVPCELFEWRVLDTLPTQRIEVRIVNPPTEGGLLVHSSDDAYGAVQESFVIHASSERPTLPDGRPYLTFRTAPIDARTPCSIYLDSLEHRLVLLTDQDIPPADGNGVRTVEIVSRPGWGARFTVTAQSPQGAAGRVPLPGIVLTLDGLEQLPTDERGQLFLSLDAPPEQLGIATSGWRVVSRSSLDDRGSVDAETGAFTVEYGYLDVFLEREPR